MWQSQEELDLWKYFLSNHKKFKSYTPTCDCFDCSSIRKEYWDWLKELKYY